MIIMTNKIDVHPQNPQARLLQQAIKQIRKGAVFVYPTDSSYAIGCHVGDKAGLDRIRALRQLDENHNFTLVCRDLSEISNYAKIDKHQYRLLKSHTPGAYTFILEATREVPRRLMHPKRKTIGLRVPDNTIAQTLLTELGEPILSVTLQLPNAEFAIAEIADIPESVINQIDLIIDGGYCGNQSTTVVDMSTAETQIIRYGAGSIDTII
jgi:tRNA threonylcarbamoyl adenosine modification protein (Sua5/YciO/YrdC/YwlC family)